MLIVYADTVVNGFNPSPINQSTLIGNLGILGPLGCIKNRQREFSCSLPHHFILYI